jgi:hypothetical protein
MPEGLRCPFCHELPAIYETIGAVSNHTYYRLVHVCPPEKKRRFDYDSIVENQQVATDAWNTRVEQVLGLFDEAEFRTWALAWNTTFFTWDGDPYIPAAHHHLTREICHAFNT